MTNQSRTISGGIFTAVLFFILAYFMRPMPGWYQLDVGQGDAALLIGEHGTRILIDVGDGRLIQHRLDAILPPWDRHIDFVVITHTDADHAGGLVPLHKNRAVMQLLWTGTDISRPEIEEVILALKSSGRASLIPADKQSIDIDGWRLSFLWPYRDVHGLASSQSNDASIVTLGSFHGMRFISSGDASIHSEQTILQHQQWRSKADHAVNVMKIGHHGSLSSTSIDWISAWQPSCVVISSGTNNPYGHPHPLILSRITGFLSDAQIHRTDTQYSFWYHVVDGEVIAEPLALSHHRVFDRIKDTIYSYLSTWRYSYGNRTNTNHSQTRCGPTQARGSNSAGV